MIILQLTSDQLNTVILDALRQALQDLQLTPSPTASSRKHLNVEEAARFLSLAVPTVYSLVSKGEIPHFKKGKRLYFDERELEAWVESGRRKTASETKAEALSFLRSKKRRA